MTTAGRQLHYENAARTGPSNPRDIDPPRSSSRVSPRVGDPEGEGAFARTEHHAPLVRQGGEEREPLRLHHPHSMWRFRREEQWMIRSRTGFVDYRSASSRDSRSRLAKLADRPLHHRKRTPQWTAWNPLRPVGPLNRPPPRRVQSTQSVLAVGFDTICINNSCHVSKARRFSLR